MTSAQSKLKSASERPHASKRPQQPQIKGNRRGVYKIAGGYYLNWQALAEVHRQAFSAKKYGSMRRALAKACQLYDYLERNRSWIEEIVREIKSRETLQGDSGIEMSDSEIEQLVKKALKKDPARMEAPLV